MNIKKFIKENLKGKYKIIKKIEKGFSGSNVLLMKNKNGKKFIFKFDKGDDFKKEILINVEINKEKGKNKIFPTIVSHGGVDEKYSYYITEFIDGLHIKALYYHKPPIIKSIRKLKNIYINFLKIYSKLNKKYGFFYMDIKSDNIIYSKNKLMFIDFGISFTNKIKYSKTKEMIKKIETKIKKTIPIPRQINKTNFNMSYIDLFKYYDKNLAKISYEFIDIINIIKLYNSGVRILLFGDNKQFKISEKNIKKFNSKIPFHKKLLYLAEIL